MIAFVSASYAHRSRLAPALAAIRSALSAAGWTPRIFIEDYQFAPDDQRAMMAATQAELRACRLLVAEVTHKAIGVGIEVGYAAALGVPIVAVRHADAEPSTTVGGLAARTVVYRTPGDLERDLAQAVRDLFGEQRRGVSE
ncbi:MAG TPA: nucleoside 2-deoxyribosyltransferase [Aggregatilinea sp.]|jgi:nucleoside 2-deoxyribosyltransferase|uniref:nucleoside 2-deoxyribosyltransferase n=1 Tax=Aggregatilinea sp. TaxID=2806333 RepID=UPI002CC9D7B1|nr:nucleoside 2-deoxyribosyltransferase [Aggregatilinea sp.]HML22236.1 nucleoside 2-deoxyribosyltransferase [Aggregatilinea sp.]